ncbi:MAG: TonB family protein [Bacteroidales bacterium]|nr:TonB family protein [Bacteroidales bacterium]
MIPFITYQLKVALCMAVFTGVYFIWLRGETFHRFNRIYLLTSLLIAFAIPAIRFKVVVPAPVMIGSGIIEAVEIYADKVSATPQKSVFNPENIITLIYIFFSTLVAGYFLAHLIKLTALINRYGITRRNNCKLVFLPEGSPSFSFFRYVFISSDLVPSGYSEQVMRHEFTHARQLHSIDILLIQIIKIFQWFNPFLFLTEKALKETHEYLADGTVLEQDGPDDGYKLLLLTQVFGLRPGIFNFFNSSLIKNRLLMMTKEKSPPFRKLKYLAVIPFILLLAIMFNCSERTTNASDTETEVSGLEAVDLDAPPPPPPPPGTTSSENEPVFVFVENQATFQGGDLNDFRNWVQENVVYPAEAIENRIFGRVTVQFVVNTQGKVEDVVILRGVAPSLDQETSRVILSSPAWEPAKQGGMEVKQQFTIPVVFTLTEEDTD